MQPKQEPISIDEMKVLMFNVVLVLFPKMMQLLLQSFITPRGLLNKYNNRDLKVAITDTEKLVMEKLPKMTEFTIELCYKIIRFEHLVPEPSSHWVVPPNEDQKEITDDIKRIVFDTNDIFNKLGEDVSNSSYETFKGKVEGIVARIDSYLGLESCKQCYEEVISLDTQLDICLRELQKLREIDVTGTTSPSLSDIEIQNGERFARIGWVIIDLFPKILRAVIQMKIAADVLFTHCSPPPYWGRFSYEEQNKLKSLNTSNTYDLLDIPLVYRLLRQFSLIKEPTNAWGQPPSSSDISTGDDIERIRFLRNDFAHRSNINTTQSEFDDTFSTFKDICRRMDVYFNNDRASGYENDVSRKETTPMDNQLRQKYQRSLQELENIKLRFIETPVKFYWGENVELSLKNLRQVYKDEKGKRKDVTDAKLRLQIVVQNIEDESAISRLVHKEFKDEINTEFTSIQLIKVSKGSIILHVDILREAVYSEESFQLTLVQFVYKVLQTGRLSLPLIGNLDIVLVQEKEYTTMQLLMQASAPQLCFDFEIERSEFETDMKLKAKLGETVTTMLKHSNGKGQISDVSATISSGSFGEITFAHPEFVKSETVEEITETGSDVKQNKHDSISLTPTLKKDPDRLDKSNFQKKILIRNEWTSTQREQMTMTDEEKYEEIFLTVQNLKCLLKLKGKPNDLHLEQTEVKEKFSDVKGKQLLYVEWTMACPEKWNITLIACIINDNLAAFHDEINVDYVYTETNSNLVIQTTTYRRIFRSLSSIEAVVKKFIDSIINVCSLKSSEPEELTVSAFIMTKPDDEEMGESKLINVVKKDQSMLSLKDDFVTCHHCKTVFSSDQLMRKLNRFLQLKEQTVQKDKSDHEAYYFLDTSTFTDEPQQKKRKTDTTSDVKKLEDTITSSNKSDSNILVDMKRALKKLGEIPLVDYCIDICKKSMKDLNEKWSARINPKKEQTILYNLLKKRKQRTTMVAKLKDVIHNQDEFSTTDMAYGTDIGFLDIEMPASRCNYCQIKEASQISSYCQNCNMFICDNCVKEHRMNYKEHYYIYLSNILREYKKINAWVCDMFNLIDIKCMYPDMVVIMLSDKLCIYNWSGDLINTVGTSQDINSQLACINNCRIAVTVPNCNLIHIVTIISPTKLTDLKTPDDTKMTGGITCSMEILYVAFSDAIRSIDLSGQIKRVINIPNVNILHSVNNDKMLCVYSKDDSNKTISSLDITSGKVNDFELFPFHPRYVTTDNVGNIIFIVEGVIWQADSDGKNFKIIISPDRNELYVRLAYNKESKILVTYNEHWKGLIKLYRKLE